MVNFLKEIEDIINKDLNWLQITYSAIYNTFIEIGIESSYRNENELRNEIEWLTRTFISNHNKQENWYFDIYTDEYYAELTISF